MIAILFGTTLTTCTQAIDTRNEVPRKPPTALSPVPRSAFGTPEARILTRTNAVREKRGLKVLRQKDYLSDYAESWAIKMLHQNQLYHSSLSFYKPLGWQKAGENIAVMMEYQKVVRAWLKSPPHKANLLDKSYRWVGIGVAKGSDGRYWVACVYLDPR